MDQTLVDIMPYLMITTIVGMILCFQIVRMVLLPREAKENKLSRREEKKRKRRGDKDPGPIQVDQASLERLLARAEDLSHRVHVLEEIMTEDRNKEKAGMGS